VRSILTSHYGHLHSLSDSLYFKVLTLFFTKKTCVLSFRINLIQNTISNSIVTLP